MGEPGNEGAGSAPSQVAELSRPGSKGPRLPGGATSVAIRQTSPAEVLMAGGGQGVVAPFCSHAIVSAVFPSTPHHSPGRKAGQESLSLFLCKQMEAQRGSPSSVGSHGKVVTARPSRLPHALWKTWPDRLSLSCFWPLVVTSGRWKMIPQHPVNFSCFSLCV